MTKCGAIVLAAGASSRFGADKRHHNFIHGNSILETTLGTYSDVFDQITVVLRPGERKLARKLELKIKTKPLKFIFSENTHLGMGHSLAAGIGAANEWDYSFIGLGDMPYVLNETLLLLKQNTDCNSIIIPEFSGQFGHPVGFPKRYFGEISGLTGDQGARKIIEANKDQLKIIKTKDKGVLLDIDNPTDLH
tara:strand:- start:287 stop:862 length:576 start_codon:yes stop_codon:yes gene_type:complete